MLDARLVSVAGAGFGKGLRLGIIIWLLPIRSMLDIQFDGYYIILLVMCQMNIFPAKAPRRKDAKKGKVISHKLQGHRGAEDGVQMVESGGILSIDSA